MPGTWYRTDRRSMFPTSGSAVREKVHFIALSFTAGADLPCQTACEIGIVLSQDRPLTSFLMGLGQSSIVGLASASLPSCPLRLRC